MNLSAVLVVGEITFDLLLGKQVIYDFKKHPKSAEWKGILEGVGIIEHFFLANVEPDVELVEKYYCQTVDYYGNRNDQLDLVKRLLKPVKVHRLVICKIADVMGNPEEREVYLVLPQSLWSYIQIIDDTE